MYMRTTISLIMKMRMVMRMIVRMMVRWRKDSTLRRHSHQFRSFLKTGGYLNHQDQPPLRWAHRVNKQTTQFSVTTSWMFLYAASCVPVSC